MQDGGQNVPGCGQKRPPVYSRDDLRERAIGFQCHIPARFGKGLQDQRRESAGRAGVSPAARAPPRKCQPDFKDFNARACWFRRNVGMVRAALIDPRKSASLFDMKEKISEAEMARRLKKGTADEDKYFPGVLGNPVTFAARWGLPL